MPDDRRGVTILLIMAGIGAGVVAGVVIGLAVAGSKRRDVSDEIADSVDHLRDRAEAVLHDLSESIAELRDKSQRIADELASAALSTGDGV